MCHDHVKKTSQPAQTSDRHAPALPLAPDETNGEAPDETDGETVNLSTDDPPAPVFEALIAEQERAWEVVKISKLRVQSNVYDHVHQIKINWKKVSIMLSLFSIHHNNYAKNSYHSVQFNYEKGSKESFAILETTALQCVKSGNYWVCMICESEGFPLLKCLKKMKVGYTINVNTHLKDKHKSTRDTMQKDKAVSIYGLREFICILTMNGKEKLQY